MKKHNILAQLIGTFILKIGILTFHQCINYGSYWQTHCLANGLRKRGYMVEILNHQSARTNFAEWKCALQPVLPTAVPSSDIPLYRKKVERFFNAFELLPLSKAFSLDDTWQMNAYDLVIVGSDEVWNLSHPWYGYKSIFYGDNICAKRLIAYAASFGNYDASAGLEKDWANKLCQFEKISVRDRNSQTIIRNALGFEPEVVLDPCLQFPSDFGKRALPFSEPFIAVYGHNLSDYFIRNICEWAACKKISLISIGYRNDWADEQWLTADPFDFAAFMAQSEAVVTNFFHGSIFALLNTKPFVCEASAYRSHKINDLMKSVGGEKHLVCESTQAAVYAALLTTPLDEMIQKNIASMRSRANVWLDAVLQHNSLNRYELI
jgi:hypothetical protein